MKRAGFGVFSSMILVTFFYGLSEASFWKDKQRFWEPRTKILMPVDGRLEIPVKEINDGRAHYFSVRAGDGTMVRFFTLMSRDGIIRAAIDACNVCHQEGKGYDQDGDFMICRNCGQRFQATKINVLRGGCNPAPLDRHVSGDKLIISMADIDKNSWYCRFMNE